MKQSELVTALKEAKFFTTRVAKSGDCHIVYKMAGDVDLKRFEERLRDVLKCQLRQNN